MCLHRTTASESSGVKHVPAIQELLLFLRGQPSERKGICRQRGREAHSSSPLADRLDLAKLYRKIDDFVQFERKFS